MTAKMTASFQMNPAVDMPRMKTNAAVERPHDPNVIPESTICQWKSCHAEPYTVFTTPKGDRYFCRQHTASYANWREARIRKVTDDTDHTHEYRIQTPYYLSETVTACCTICAHTRELAAYADPKKFWVSATRETARNRYQNDDDEARIAHIVAREDANQAIEDDLRNDGHDAYGHPYSDPPNYDSQPNELLFLAPQGYLTYENDHCRHQSAYEDRTYLVGRDANDDPIYVTEEADGFCQRCEEYVEHRPTPQPTIPPTSADWRVRARREAGQRAADRVEAARSRREAARARREQGEANIEAARAEIQAFIAEHQPDAPQLELGI